MSTHERSRRVFLVSALAGLLIMTQSAMPQLLPPAVQQLIKELPPCSVLHEELEHGEQGDGIDQPYMAKMRQLGVRRAELDMGGVVRGRRAEDIRVRRRLYFREFDGPNSEVSDEATLREIEGSGLQADLDTLAHSRASIAPVVWGEWRPFAGNQVRGFVEFFANPWLPRQEVLWSRSGRPERLTSAVLEADAVGTRALLRMHRFGKKELDRALFASALSRYDNSTVIKLLLDAGADVNARASNGSTPLFSAVSRPCNIIPLLAAGADPNARDESGETALQIARQQKVGAAIHILEQAGTKTHTDATGLR